MFVSLLNCVYLPLIVLLEDSCYYIFVSPEDSTFIGKLNVELKYILAFQIIREMQVKTTMKYHLTPVRMAIIKKSTNNRCWRGCGENGNVNWCSHYGEQYGGSLKN